MEIKEVNIINHWFDQGNVCKKHFFQKDYLLKEFTAGIIGPEIKNTWDNISVIENIKIKYSSNKYDDILIWQRNTSNENNNWIIVDINNIIKN